MDSEEQAFDYPTLLQIVLILNTLKVLLSQYSGFSRQGHWVHEMHEVVARVLEVGQRMWSTLH